MRRVLLLAAMLCVCVLANAQDIITFKNGEEVEAKLLEIGKYNVKYRLFSEPEGVIYTVGKNELLMVKHESGRNEVFSSNGSSFSGAYGTYSDYSPYIPHVDGIRPGMKYSELKHMYNHSEYISLPGDPYSPAWSGVASFFIPGLGQMICGEVGRGFAFLGGQAGLALASAAGVILAAYELPVTGGILMYAGSLGMIALDIASIVDAVYVAKVKNMYVQDLRHNYSFDIRLHPSVDVMQVGNKLQPTVGMTLALKF